MPIFTYKDININYIDEGSGEPIVFIAGTFTKLQSWNYQIAYFKERLRVIAYDNRGSGKSSRPDYPYTMEMMIEDLKNLLDHLSITEGVHFCGSSMGAMISQSFALKYPKAVKSLILCAPSSYYPSKTCDQNTIAFNNLKNLESKNERVEYFFPLIYSRSFKKQLMQNKDLYDQISKDMNFCAQLVDPPSYKDYVNQNEALRNFEIRDSIENISAPTLILTGTKDKMSIPGEVESIHQKIPNSVMETLVGMGHAFNIEAPEETNHFIWNFIEKHLG